MSHFVGLLRWVIVDRKGRLQQINNWSVTPTMDPGQATWFTTKDDATQTISPFWATGQAQFLNMRVAEARMNIEVLDEAP
jgi:hypothetical protein